MGKKAASSVDLSADMRVIILRGKDRFLQLERTREIAEGLREAHGEIDTFTFEGDSAELADLLDELRSYGLMCAHKLVILEKADEFLPRNDSAYRRAMERYAEQPVEDATLVLRAETWRPGNLDKKVAKVGAVVKCEPPSTAQAEGWCVKRCAKRHGCEIERPAATLLVDQIGPDLGRLDTEMAKLAACLAEGESITRKLVGEMVGFSREEQVWALQSVIASGEPREAATLLWELLEFSNQPTELVTWAINDLLRKLHAAAQMLRQGATSGMIAKQLRLWKDADPILNAAKRLSPVQIAQLLQQSIENARRIRRGTANPERSLEALTILLADTIRAA